MKAANVSALVTLALNSFFAGLETREVEVEIAGLYLRPFNTYLLNARVFPGDDWVSLLSLNEEDLDDVSEAVINVLQKTRYPCKCAVHFNYLW